MGNNDTDTGCVCGCENIVAEHGLLWCSACGVKQVGRVEYVRSYNSPQTHRRFPMYSRIKRFISWMRSLRLELSVDECEEILNLFTLLELKWSVSEKSRRYFFNKGCVLQFCLDFLGMKHLSVHTLKDADRVKNQMRAMAELL